MIKKTGWTLYSFFSKHFLGIGIDLDFYGAQVIDTLFTFQLTLLFWRIWFVKYK